MVDFLPPALTTTFLVATIAPLVVGFLVGIIAKTVLKLGVAIAVLLLILIALGIVDPNQIVGPLASMVTSGQTYAEKVKQIAGYLPYSSVAFLIGLAVGFFKG